MIGDPGKDDMAVEPDRKAAHARNGVPKAQRPKRPKKPKAENQLAPVMRAWLGDVITRTAGETATADAIETLVAQAPKRWVIYEPMVLLPTGSFGFACVPGQAAAAHGGAGGLTWQSVLASASDAQTSALWRDILAVLSRGAARLTHLAVNEGIPLHVGEADQTDREREREKENILRSPTGLRPLYGDFGPATTATGRDDDPSDDDLAAAFWVSTVQNGIYQTWAPRWSMFSRGNVTEKARLLAWPSASAAAADTRETALDLYAGIGYFVFSYARRGLRVLGWELNPWSTEALRRGAVRNGWTVQIVRGAALAQPTAEVVDASTAIVIFVEDNQNAARRLAELRQTGTPLAITHVNGGLLPTSRPIWRTAWDAVAASSSSSSSGGDSKTHTGWLHLHDNVGVDELDERRAEIQALADALGASAGGAVESVVEHTELVKTFAPGVWHCVFDVRVRRRAE